jgi:hypothetical protein
MTSDVLAKNRSVFLVLAVVCGLVLQLHADNAHLVHVMKGLKLGLVGSSTTSTDSDLANSFTTATAPTTTAEDSSQATMNGTKIFFVHVGKTGGTTLRETVLRFGCRFYRNLKKKAKCEEFIKTHGESALGKQTTGAFHYEFKYPRYQKQRRKMDLLYVVREPIARFASSYEFINPHNCIRGKNEMEMENKCRGQAKAQDFPDSFNAQFYYDCFPTIQAFLNYKPPPKKVDESDQKASEDKCEKLWSDAFRPGRSVYGHMRANYQYYTKDMGLLKKGRKVWVIRTESLWEDVSHVDTLVGGTGNYSHVQGRTMNKQSIAKGAIPRKKYVPLPFCCGLLPDMLAFRDIINRADNFNDQEKRETNERSWSRCNVTSWGMLETKCGGKGS